MKWWNIICIQYWNGPWYIEALFRETIPCQDCYMSVFKQRVNTCVLGENRRSRCKSFIWFVGINRQPFKQRAESSTQSLVTRLEFKECLGKLLNKLSYMIYFWRWVGVTRISRFFFFFFTVTRISRFENRIHFIINNFKTEIYSCLFSGHVLPKPWFIPEHFLAWSSKHQSAQQPKFWLNCACAHPECSGDTEKYSEKYCL